MSELMLSDLLGILQGITSCLALYFTWKLFKFTRKKPQINLQYHDGKWILINKGDFILSNATITLIDVYFDEFIMDYEDINGALDLLEERFIAIKDRKIGLPNIGINQIIEISDILFFGKGVHKGMSIFSFMGTRRMLDELVKEGYVEKTFINAEEKNKNFDPALLESVEFVIKGIICLELKVMGDGYDQVIKYMR